LGLQPDFDVPQTAGQTIAFAALAAEDENNYLQTTGEVFPGDFLEAGTNPALSSAAELDSYLLNLFMPWKTGAEGFTVATANMSGENVARIRARYGNDTILLSMPKRALTAAIEQLYRSELIARSTSALKRARPEFSAEKTFTIGQAVVLCGIPLIFLAALFAIPTVANLALAILCALGYLANGLFRILLVWVGAGEHSRAQTSVLPAEDDGSLPFYTILVPLYREGNMLPALVTALRALAYPMDRLDIKLVLEADDAETIAAAEALPLESSFEIIRVPPGLPRTKPKACNYAMQFARGEYIVIFDAEDRPEPDQLLKAIAAFRAAPSDVACLQARLNFYNASENWLTCMFALDYALWFDFLLPGLDRLGVPMPLGGTSNHFRTDALRAIHGWDPYNVTEDADLGIRLAQMGYRVTTLDSTTFEEATNELGNWLRQRSRWLKGYMQTWLVHMRRPRGLLKTPALKGFLAFNFSSAARFSRPCSTRSFGRFRSFPSFLEFQA
jgi:glycosyltransferase XagB